MKLLALLPSIILLATPVAAQTIHEIWKPPIVQGVAAQVEDHIITYEDLRREMAPLVPRLQQESRTQEEFDQKMGQLYLDVMQSLIDRQIIVKEFKDKEYQIPQSVIENEYDRILIEDFDNDRAQFHKHLQAQGENVREFRKDLREQIIVSVMRSNMRKSVSQMSPEKIERYYEDNKVSFFQEEAVKLRLIMLKPIGDESRDLMRQQAEKIISELDSGKEFAEAAREYSQDTRRARGGDWGWVTRKDVNEQLADTAFSLQAGQHSDPVFLGNQIFILHVEDHRSEGIQPLREVRDQIEDILAGQLSRQAQQAWLEKLRRKAYIRYY